jgi:fructose-specific phosphotransferase system component IIB
MSAHAMEEMAEDLLDIFDVEKAVSTGRIHRIHKDDFRGARFVIHGLAADQQTRVAVVGRFVDGRRFLIITVYVVP